MAICFVILFQLKAISVTLNTVYDKFGYLYLKCGLNLDEHITITHTTQLLNTCSRVNSQTQYMNEGISEKHNMISHAYLLDFHIILLRWLQC